MKSVDRTRLTLETCLGVVVAVVSACGLAMEVPRHYGPVRTYAPPLAPERVATPTTLLWVILGSTAAVAWRGGFLGQLAARVTGSSMLVAIRLQVPASYGCEAVFPVASFGLFVVAPLVLWRGFPRTREAAWASVDSWGVAALTCHFVVDQYVPKL